MDDERLKIPFALKGKRVWIAGHNGMVGGALLRRLQLENCEILTVDKSALDLREQAAARKWMKANKPDVVLLAAARVGGILANASHPAQFLYDNLMIETNVIHAAYETDVQRLLFLGSSCIYPKHCPQPMKEEYLLTGALEPTNEAYAIAKIAGLKMTQFYRQQYGCDFISAMPCNLYGVGDTYDAQKSHVIPALILKMHAAKINGDSEVVLWGSGSPLREFLDVDELADGLVHILKYYNTGEPINIGSGEENSIRKLAEVIREVIGFEGEISFDPSRPDGTSRKLMDISRLTSLGWRSKLCLNNGIKKAYMDYKGRNWDDNTTGHYACDHGRRATDKA